MLKDQVNIWVEKHPTGHKANAPQGKKCYAYSKRSPSSAVLACAIHFFYGSAARKHPELAEVHSIELQKREGHQWLAVRDPDVMRKAWGRGVHAKTKSIRTL